MVAEAGVTLVESCARDAICWFFWKRSWLGGLCVSMSLSAIMLFAFVLSNNLDVDFDFLMFLDLKNADFDWLCAEVDTSLLFCGLVTSEDLNHANWCFPKPKNRYIRDVITWMIDVIMKRYFHRNESRF